MSVRQVIRRKSGEVVTIAPDQDMGTAVGLLLKHRIGGLPVVEAGGVLVGFLSERDVVQAVDRSPLGVRHLRADQVMHRPPPTCSVDDPLQAVMSRMTAERLRHLVVMDGTGIAGVLSVGDLVKHRLEQLETEAGVLRDYVAAQRATR
jgi:CBS domain-containing protein